MAEFAANIVGSAKTSKRVIASIVTSMITTTLLFTPISNVVSDKAKSKFKRHYTNCGCFNCESLDYWKKDCLKPEKQGLTDGKRAKKAVAKH
ncbi:uncharacterized protein BT62DRAFT_928434 [Guyanagaster necrorhizus]|uniref:Uncharacterized protein n=1 Tax=Guyanagaster necrorhizus TaxID=856835 RepID=A0A9P7VY47_9AGAR|nr:uncharacterized protein BT62DRAFT_928434 [Guyanagaster necrorhizus MCA 3950]KAG7449701.1 hypothetical protein BT62DRAFT_928434 [Guyanagaster necrorhizus MCA 3950]